MSLRSCLVSAGLLLVAAGAVVLAQKPALNIKMGLWELTTNSQVGGQMPGIDTSNMTPEQKAKLEAMMKSTVMGAHTNVIKSCITQEKFDKANFMMTDQDASTCKQTVSTNTSTSLDAAVTCTGERGRTGQVHIEALSSTTFTGAVKFTMTQNGRAMTVDGTMAGKWLAADCGAVK
jgi:Protein of unknown function (DUF3617)